MDPDKFIQKSNGRAKFSYKAILLAMNQEIYLKSASNSAGMSKFKNDIISNIDRGVPVIWRVRTGLFGKHRTRIGKHRRLIVGYNLRENTMIYSDSWGAENKHKKVSMEKAWASSNGITLCLPKSLASSGKEKEESEEDDDDVDDVDDDQD